MGLTCVNGRRRPRPRRSCLTSAHRAPRRRARGAPLACPRASCARGRAGSGRRASRSARRRARARPRRAAAPTGDGEPSRRPPGSPPRRIRSSVSSNRIGSIDQIRSHATSIDSSAANRSLAPSPPRASSRAAVRSNRAGRGAAQPFRRPRSRCPGRQTTPPHVHTAPPPVRRAISRISSASFAAPASASRRLSIGVEPAWAA